MTNDTRRNLGLGAIVSIYLLWAFGAFDSPAPPDAKAETKTVATRSSTKCETANLPYNQSIKDQVAELCEWGMPRDQAIDGLKVVYRNPSINPAAAVSIVKTGAGIAQIHADPLRYAGQGSAGTGSAGYGSPGR